jgi:UDP-N-acetylglucosamine--N-acetylmuramyl-(pentapeptide) pyrophosphoryl-undecaprenol N-acetylglucosamine transferase
MGAKLIFLCAGGTGGHLFPAEALAHEVKSRGYRVHLVTDSRAERFAGKFPADEIHVIPSATFGSKNPFAMLKTLLTLWSGVRKAKVILARHRPAIVVGFGGYPTIPPLFAATKMRLPTLIHEQNAVMGRANKALASRVSGIAGGFLNDRDPVYGPKIVVTGNPVRPAVLEAATIPYLASGEQDAFNLVVFGGSQGAQYFSKVLPEAVSLLDPSLQARLRICQQARAEDLDALVAAYKKIGLSADISPFFNDMAERIGKAHLVISRSGASTVSEVSVIGRPALFVPYPHALDHDQAANAATLKAMGGADVIVQAELTPTRLAEILNDAMRNPVAMQVMAAASRRAGKPDATRLLADCVDAIATGQSISDVKETHL